MYLTPFQTTIITTGVAASTFSHASFAISIVTGAETGPEAKEKAKERIEAVLKVVTDMAEAAKIEADRLKTTFSIEPWYVHEDNNRVHKGYKATYTLSFHAKEVSEATNVHDALTSINGITAETPVFHVDRAEDALKAAFQDAWDKAVAEKVQRCAIMGMKPEMWKIAGWEEQGRDGGGGGGKAMSASPGKPKIEPGKAMIHLTIGFLFRDMGAPLLPRS